MIEVVLTSPTERADLFWQQGGAAWQYWFVAEELAALAPRRNRAAATMARLLGKCAVRSALRRAGLDRPPSARELRIGVEPGGRPFVDMPESCADWLAARGLGLDLSLSHAHTRALAVAMLT
jgi:phosphopantetheinyl transferase (holo-ACP synthase)